MDFATAGTLVTLDRNFSNHSSTETTPQIWIWWHMGRILRTPTTRCPRLPLLQGPWRPKMLDEADDVDLDAHGRCLLHSWASGT